MGLDYLFGPYLVCLNKRLDKRLDKNLREIKSDLEGKFAIVVFNNKKSFGEIPFYSASLEGLGIKYAKSKLPQSWKRPLGSMIYEYNLVPTDKGIFSVNVKERKDISEFGNGIKEGIEKIEYYPFSL
jgi:hypothetical protein